MAGLEEWLPPPGNWRYKNRLIVRRIPFFTEWRASVVSQVIIDNRLAVTAPLLSRARQQVSMTLRVIEGDENPCWRRRFAESVDDFRLSGGLQYS